ncbi:MAG: glycoside hydrolase family 3 protein [Clostridia bacterium]|nr:glycoside hydrolase family 3 protein [Clostridia bacterium]
MSLKQISRGFTTAFTAVFTVMIGLTSLAFEAENDVNQLLNTSSYKIVETGEEVDSEYFKKKTSSISQFMQQKLNIIERITDEGTVLLKNEKTLPLAPSAKVTLLGKASFSPVYGGSSGNAAIGNQGNSNINWSFKRGLEQAGFSVNEEMWNFYAGKKPKYDSAPSEEISPSELPMSSVGNYSDAVIVVLSRVTGEGGDAQKNYYELDDKEKALIKAAEEQSNRVIVIVNSPSPLAINELKKDPKVGAILQIGGLGALGAKSVGNILSGKVNPSGKLTDTYAADSRSSAAYQSAYTVPYANADKITAAAQAMGVGAGGTKYTVFNEGIYVGYKYYETRYEDCVLNQGNASSSKGAFKSTSSWSYADEVDYSFGYGLSYTEFKEELVSCEVKDDVVTAQVKVTNTGSVAGKSAVQLYVQSPYTDYDKENGVEKSAIQLVNIGKTKELQPNTSETVTVKMDLYNIASYDYRKAKTWILDEGKYYFAVGNGAHDALNNVLAAKKENGVSVSGMDGAGDASLVYAWNNDSFRTLGEYTFDEDGYTTENGLFHNNTETAVTNRLDKADLNNLVGAGTTTYLSRSDWDKTWCAGLQSVTATAEMIDRITFKRYTPGEPVGDTYEYGADTTYSLIMAKGKAYDDEIWDQILNQLMVEEMIATVGKNFGAIDPILGLGFNGTSDNDGVGSGPCVAYPASYDTGETVIEGESKYSKIEPRMYPSQTVEASTFNQQLIYELGTVMSEDCFYTGMTTLWGPGLNLHRHPYAGRNFEYFSEDSMLTYLMGAQVTAGVQYNGVVCGPKHFAFNDQETDRYGFAVYTNEQAGRENSLRGFEGAVAVAKAGNVMTSLNRIGCDWIGVSTELQNDILRDEWGFLGYTITDNALEPYMCGLSIAFGNDKLMLLPGNDRSGELNKTALLNDVTLFGAVREACHRILYVYANSKAMNGVSSSTMIVKVMPWWKTALVNLDVIVGCLVALGIVGYVASYHEAREEQ